MLDSHLITFRKRLIISGLFFICIISYHKDLKFFQVHNLKRKKNGELTKNLERSGLEPKTIQESSVCPPAWAICELTIAGGKKVDQTISNRTATDYLCLHCSARYTVTRRFRLALFEKDKLMVSELIFLG